MKKAKRRVALLCRELRPGDATANDTLLIEECLLRAGYEVRLFAEVMGVGPPERSGRIAELPQFVSHADDILLYQFCIGWPAAEEIFSTVTCRKLLRYHNVTPPEFFRGFSPSSEEACQIGLEEIRRIVNRPCDLFLPVSEFNLQGLVSLGADAAACRILPPFHRIDATPADESIRARYSDGVLNIICVGRITPNKAQHKLVHAYADLCRRLSEPSRLILVGDCLGFVPYTNAVRTAVKERGLGERVQLLDKVSAPTLRALYETAHLFALRSEHEGFGVPLVEAMAAGVPVVAQNSAAIGETVGTAGELVTSADPAAFARAMEKVLRDPQRQAELEKRGSLRYQERFAPPVVEKDLRAILCSLSPRARKARSIRAGLLLSKLRERVEGRADRWITRLDRQAFFSGSPPPRLLRVAEKLPGTGKIFQRLSHQHGLHVSPKNDRFFGHWDEVQSYYFGIEQYASVKGWLFHATERTKRLELGWEGKAFQKPQPFLRPDLRNVFTQDQGVEKMGFAGQLPLPLNGFQFGQALTLKFRAELESGRVVEGQLGSRVVEAPTDPMEETRRSWSRSRKQALQEFLETGKVLALPAVAEPRLSVIVVAFNRAELLLGCLRSLLEICVPYEVVVVDNASTDDTRVLLERISGVRVHRNATNLHFIRGANQGASLARGESLLFLNSDAELTPGSAEAALEALHSEPDVGAVGAKIIGPDGRLQEAGSQIARDARTAARGAGEDPELPIYQKRVEIDYCSGCFLLTPARLFRELGPFDPELDRAYYEDVQYCVSLQRAGYRVLYEPSARVLHLGGGSMQDPILTFKIAERNRALFRRKAESFLRSHRPRHGRLDPPAFELNPDGVRIIALGDKRLSVHQVCFNEKTRAETEPCFNPCLNSKPSPYMENEPIHRLLSQGAARSADYVGVLSWRFRRKIPLHPAELVEGMLHDELGSDVYTFFGAVGRDRVWKLAEQAHPGLLATAQRLFDSLGLGIRADRLSGPIVYQNHFIARSPVFERYHRELLQPCLEKMSSGQDEKLEELLQQDASYAMHDPSGPMEKDELLDLFGKPYPTMHPFLCERLFSTWLAMNPEVKVRNLWFAHYNDR